MLSDQRKQEIEARVKLYPMLGESAPKRRYVEDVTDLLSALTEADQRIAKLETICDWQQNELEKRLACVNCGEEPAPNNPLYPTVCPSCRRCYQCAEPMCPTCGDREGTIMRARDLLRENGKLKERIASAEQQRDEKAAEARTFEVMLPPLHKRIAELKAESQRLREALEQMAVRWQSEANAIHGTFATLASRWKCAEELRSILAGSVPQET